MALPNTGGGYQIGDGNLNEIRLGTVAAHVTATDTATLTVAQTINGVIVATPTAAAAFTLPLVSDLEATLTDAHTGSFFEFSVVNVATNGSYDITMTTNTGWTLTGNMVVESNDADRARSSARFRARKTGDSAWSLIRLA